MGPAVVAGCSGSAGAVSVDVWRAIAAAQLAGETLPPAGPVRCRLLPVGVEQARDESPRLGGPTWPAGGVARYRLRAGWDVPEPEPWVDTYLAHVRSAAAAAGVDLLDVVWRDGDDW
jgi:hypothetical protein